jgi:hypothetical protein
MNSNKMENEPFPVNGRIGIEKKETAADRQYFETKEEIDDTSGNE